MPVKLIGCEKCAVFLVNKMNAFYTLFIICVGIIYQEAEGLGICELKVVISLLLSLYFVVVLLFFLPLQVPILLLKFWRYNHLVNNLTL